MLELFRMDWDATLPTDDDEVENITVPDIPNRQWHSLQNCKPQFTPQQVTLIMG